MTDSGYRGCVGALPVFSFRGWCDCSGQGMAGWGEPQERVRAHVWVRGTSGAGGMPLDVSLESGARSECTRGVSHQHPGAKNRRRGG